MRALYAGHDYSVSVVHFRLNGIPCTEDEHDDEDEDDSKFRNLGLACIGHKSLEICDRCRLWQQNSPAAPKILLLLERGV